MENAALKLFEYPERANYANKLLSKKINIDNFFCFRKTNIDFTKIAQTLLISLLYSFTNFNRKIAISKF
jgi:hypothetical protein